VRALLHEVAHKRHIIWDWNGTLLDDLEHNVATMNWLLSSEGLPSITVDHHREHFGFPVRDYYEKLGFDVSTARFPVLCQQFNARFHENIDRCTLAAGSMELVEQLRMMGKKQSILSATEQETLSRSVAQFGIDHYFDHVCGIANDQAASKLDRGHALLAESGIDPRDTVLIGDTIHDLEVGKALDVEVVLLAHGHQSSERLRAAHRTVLQWDWISL
jgi:phosphoglycolate phosphatase